MLCNVLGLPTGQGEGQSYINGETRKMPALAIKPVMNPSGGAGSVLSLQRMEDVLWVSNPPSPGKWRIFAHTKALNKWTKVERVSAAHDEEMCCVRELVWRTAGKDCAGFGILP